MEENKTTLNISELMEDHVDYYNNNPEYVEVKTSAEEVASFLREQKKLPIQ
jgi:UDP-N-acetylmuramoylalanine-D-glutamate ligase